MNNYAEQWIQQLKSLSGNLTTNEVMPEALINKLLEDDKNLADKLRFSEVTFPSLGSSLDRIDGLNILAGLQRQTKEGYLTVYRGVRFPTYKRLYDLLSEHGLSISNYEQERILELYNSRDYIEKRNELKSDPWFWTQPQERVVEGLPLFCLVNDALQIHKAFRGDRDLTAMVVVHIPQELIETGKIRLVANPAIDLEYENTDREFALKDFVTKNGVFQPDYASLRARGIDLHEMYTADLPMSITEANALGVIQEFYLLDIYRVVDHSAIKELKLNTELLKQNRDFLHGFFGDQNIFGRRETSYLPSRCVKVEKV